MEANKSTEPKDSMYLASSSLDAEAIRASSGWKILLIVVLCKSLLWDGLTHSLYPAVPTISDPETGPKSFDFGIDEWLSLQSL